MTTAAYSVPAMHCMHCVNTIKTEMIELDGVRTVDVDLQSKKVTITYEDPATPEKIENLLTEINFPPQKV
jgi:copper chaperone